MTVKFVQAGHSIDYTPGADVASGEVVIQGDHRDRKSVV